MSASPKRPSLDERLEKELGIKMQPDFSRPPPGYLPALAPQQQKQQQRLEPFPVAAHHLPPPPKPAINVLPPPPQHHQLIQQQPPPHHLPQQQQQPPILQPPPRDAPEEGRLVRVGNMLQIVPDEEGEVKAAAAATPVPAPPPPPPDGGAVNPETDAEALMRRMEEMKRKKEIERRLKREKRMAERMQVGGRSHCTALIFRELPCIDWGTLRTHRWRRSRRRPRAASRRRLQRQTTMRATERARRGSGSRPSGYWSGSSERKKIR